MRDHRPGPLHAGAERWGVQDDGAVEEATNLVARYEITRPSRVGKPVHCLREQPGDRDLDKLVAALQQEVQRMGDKPAPQTGLAAPGICLPYLKGLFEVQDLKATKMLELLQKLVDGPKITDRSALEHGPPASDHGLLEERPEAARGPHGQFDAGQGPEFVGSAREKGTSAGTVPRE